VDTLSRRRPTSVCLRCRYTKKRDRDHLALICRPTGVAAFRVVLPEMPEQQAKMETTHAIAFAAALHTTWFWGGITASADPRP